MLSVMNHAEIWRTAGDLVVRHGPEGAAFEAASKADRFRTEGDSLAARDWVLVLEAVEDIVRPLGTAGHVN